VLNYRPVVKGRMYMIPWPAREVDREDGIAYEPDEEITAADVPF